MISGNTKVVATFFVLLALGALGYDVYIWRTTENPFEFAALGWIFKHDFKDTFDLTVDTLGADNFNMLLTPILAHSGFVIGMTLAAISLAIGAITGLIRQNKTGGNKKAEPKGFSYKRR